MSFIGDAQRYAQFLRIDRQVPEPLGMWLGGFMMMAQRYEFFTEPSIWFPRRPSQRTMARVYFTPWSQNKLCALRHLHGKYFFCAVERDVFVAADEGGQRSIFSAKFHSSDFSGSHTREVFYNAKEGLQWLKSQLAATS